MEHTENSQSDDIAGKTLAELSHDIRNLINSIIGCSDLMCSDPHLAPANKNYAKTINENGKRLWFTLDKIIRISRLNTGKEMLSGSSFDLRVLIEDLKIFASMQGIPAQIELVGDFPYNLIGDTEKIRELLTGLLMYAGATNQCSEIIVEIRVQTCGTGEVLTGTMLAEQNRQDRSLGLSPVNEQQNTARYPDCPAKVHLALSHGLARLMQGHIIPIESMGYGFEIQVKKGERQLPHSAFSVHGPCAENEPGVIPDLSGIPDEIIKEMQAAAKGARLDLLSHLVNKIAKRNPDLAACLHSAMKTYNYDLIFSILRITVKN